MNYDNNNPVGIATSVSFMSCRQENERVASTMPIIKSAGKTLPLASVYAHMALSKEPIYTTAYYSV